jgi:hypothetical protein
MTEEIKKRIEEIKKRYSILPRRMDWKKVDVPKKIQAKIKKVVKIQDPEDPMKFIDVERTVKDPNQKGMINDPRGVLEQRRDDIIDLDDPYEFPLIHFHTYPDKREYNPRAEEMGGCFINMPKDIDFLIQLLEEKQNGN